MTSKTNFSLPQRHTRKVRIGSVTVGGDSPIAVQSMCATKTTEIETTLKQIQLLDSAGADYIRIAVDSRNDVEALKSIRPQTDANLVIDLQENYRLAKDVAPFVQKIRYNPGHLHHHERERSVYDKVAFLADTAGEHDVAIRIGVNFGSLDPNLKDTGHDPLEVALESAYEHCNYLERLNFSAYLVSLKSSNPDSVVKINEAFAAKLPTIPLHLGVTEAGMLPEGEIKTRLALEHLLPQGIGDTLRVSLTLPDDQKHLEVFVARKLIHEISQGIFKVKDVGIPKGLNVISCPSCSRVENKAFVQLAGEIKEAIQFAKMHEITVAVMGCRVNGPGETDEADLGVWCAPTFVNLKKGSTLLGKYPYDEVVSVLVSEINKLIAQDNTRACGALPSINLDNSLQSNKVL